MKGKPRTDEVQLPPAVAPRTFTAEDIARLRPWVVHTRQLVADGLIRPPVGELAELLIAWAMRAERAKLAAPGWDVVADGERVQVRGLWHAGHRSRTSIGKVPKICDSIVAVEFEADLRVRVAWRLDQHPPVGMRLGIGHMRRYGVAYELGGADVDLGLAGAVGPLLDGAGRRA